MFEGVLIGFYAGVGLCVGIAFYFTNDPWVDDDPRSIRAIQAFVTGVAWLPIFIGVLGPEIVRDIHRRYVGTDSEQEGSP